MPLNYSKWDQLELSDDSDIEVHPNVDKKSFIKWKQRDIHEKREERKSRIVFLQSEIVLNNTLLPRLDDVISKFTSEGIPYFERQVSQLSAKKGDPNAERPKGSNPGQPSYDDMVLALMTTVASEVKEKGLKDTSDRTLQLEETLKSHRRQLKERTDECQKEIDKEEVEQRKHITSEDIHDGFDTSHVNKNAATAQIVDPIKAAPKVQTKKVKEKKTQIETLNPNSSGTQADAGPSKSGYASDDERVTTEEEDEEVPTLSPAAKKFTKLQIGNWEQSFNALSKEPTLLKDDVNDAILMEAFEASMKGDKKYTFACVHQALVLQYCRKLGRDGVALFFRRMSSNKDALKVFQNDVQQTFDRISTRSVEMLAERTAAGVNEAGEREQIQLVAQDPSTTITFEVPDGPPPEQITLEGEGSDSMDPERVKVFLQRRWEIFESFPKNLKKALKGKNLEEVNQVLGRMAVEEGEETVRLLDEAGILSFSSPDIVDKTKSAMPEQIDADQAKSSNDSTLID